MRSLDIHKNAEDELHKVLSGLINYGENNSALVIGPRGSGKTFLIKQVLQTLRHELRERNCSDDLIVIRLSGRFIFKTKFEYQS
jgi:predicted AAA+ superfamily ATPase